MGTFSPAHPSGNMAATEFDYTFTDRELQDILGFMEKQQNDADFDPSTASIPFAAGTVGLQFQPHLQPQPQPVGAGLAGVNAYSPSDADVYIKQEYANGFSHPLGAPATSGNSLDAVFSAPQNGVQVALALPNTAEMLAPQHLTLQSVQPIQLQQSSNSGKSGGKAGDLKPHISHSTVEKQRRDRINSLIDELRDLVPPQHTQPGGEVQDTSKRPKHVVLSDTIALVKELREKARVSEPTSNGTTKPEDEVNHDAQELIDRSYPESKGTHSPRSGSPPELPVAPENAPPSTGVVVERGDQCLYVKVNCKDRRGLLSDIILSLKSMPLEVTTAAVTTTRDDYVHDVFQVKIDPDSNLSESEIQCRVHAALYSTIDGHLGDKRRRTASMSTLHRDDDD